MKRNPAPSASELKQRWFHSTPDTESGRRILAAGVIAPSRKKGSGFLTPRYGYTYLSSRLETAAIYALGGVWMGGRCDWRKYTAGGEGRYGWIFLADNASFTDVEPDEDEVGILVGEAMSDALGRKPLYGVPYPVWLLGMARRCVAESRLRQVEEGYMAYQASVGKQLLKRMEDWQKMDVLSDIAASGRLGNIASKGPAAIKKAWILDKEESMRIAKDGSNVLEIAERVL